MTQNPSNDPSSASPFGPGAFDLSRFFESMDAARRHWGAFVSPAAVGASLDPGELDKRIADLRTVEQWLSLNLSLVQGSVKALEMQRATLDAMRAFGQAGPSAPPSADPVAAAAAQAQDWWQALQNQFKQVADTALNATRPAPPPSAAPAADQPARPKKAAKRRSAG